MSFGLPSTSLLGQVAFNGNWSSQADGSEGPLLYTATVSPTLGYGRMGEGPLIAAGFAGPSLAWGRESLNEERYLAGGVTVGGQFSLMPEWYWGVGVDLFANLNPRQSSIGFRFGVLVGKPR